MLHNISEREQENDNLENSMFYNHIVDQIELHNTPLRKRTCPNDSFSMTCGLQLHSMSGNHYDSIRNKCNFTLLPDKRTLFSKGNDMSPLDFFSHLEKRQLMLWFLKKISSHAM